MDIDYIFDHLYIEGKRPRENSNEQAEIFFLKCTDYKYAGLIGFGQDGIIVKLQHRETGVFYAGKFFTVNDYEHIVKITSAIETSQINEFYLLPYEIINFPTNLQDAHLANGILPVHIFGVTVGKYLTRRNFFLLYGGFFVLPLMDGDMDDSLLLNRLKSNGAFLEWAREAQHMALKHRFYHGDLGLSNILYKRDHDTVIYKITDFTHSRFIDLTDIDGVDLIKKEWEKILGSSVKIMNE